MIDLPHPGLDSAAVTSQDDDGGPGGVPGGVGEDVSPGVTPHDGAGVQVIRPQLEKKYLIYKFTVIFKILTRKLQSPTLRKYLLKAGFLSMCLTGP